MTRRPVKPPIEDESTYLTVVHPYPLNTNLRLPADRRTLALWLACCAGKPDVLRAMFYKPKAAGMVIIEVDREFEGFDTLLGMHSWSDFLLAPTEEEAGNSSKVFYCTYHNAEAVRKAGWIRVEIEDHWFQGSPLNDRIKHPYPKATYCDVPPGSKTEVPLCHRLPQQELPVNEFKENNAPKHSTTAMAMMAIFGTAPKESSVKSSATGMPRSATTGASTSGASQYTTSLVPTAKRHSKTIHGTDTIPRPDPLTKVKKRRGDEWVCLQHGPMCTPGICTAHARVDRDERWQKEREERAENKRKRMEKKERKARKRQMMLAMAEGRELPHRDQPAHLVNGPRGPSSRSRTEENGDGSHDQGSLCFRTESPEPPSASQPPVNPGQDSEAECTQTFISVISADMGRERPIAKVRSSSTQAYDIGATGKADATGLDDGDGMVMVIQQKRIQERNKDKGKGKTTEIAPNGDYGRAVQTSRPDFENVLQPEVPGDIGWSWCESSVAW